MSKTNNGLTAWETNAEFGMNIWGMSPTISIVIWSGLIRKSCSIFVKGIWYWTLPVETEFSKRLAECGTRVIAFDYSAKMIELAEKRRADVLDRVDFHVCDATNYDDC
jgi:hypothetical protein